MMRSLELEKLFGKTDDAIALSAGETLFAEGDQGDRMYVLLDGQAEIRVGGVAVETVGPGGVLGEMALIDEAPRSASVVAVSDTRLAPVDEKRFMFMVQQTPFFAMHVMRVLAARLRHMDKIA